MGARSFALTAIICVGVLMIAGCARMTGDCQESDIPVVSGSWRGVAHLGARGTVPLTVNLNQHNECVNGAWVAEDEEAMGSRAGALSGLVDQGGEMELMLDPVGWDACPLEAVLSLREGRISGRLRPHNCSGPGSGELELERVRTAILE